MSNLQCSSRNNQILPNREYFSGLATSLLVSKAALAGWIKKFFYGVLIFWVGGVGPLIYFESFSSHQSVADYQVVVLGKSVRSPKLPSALREALSQQDLNQRAGNWLATSGPFLKTAQFVAPNTTPFFLSIFRDGHLLLITQVTMLSTLAFFDRVLIVIPNGSSAWLPPPEKPPTSFLSGR